MSQDDLSEIAKIGARIRVERKRLNLNQTDFAALTGVELTTQSRYEQGKQRPKLDYLSAAARAGADTQFILTGQQSGGDALSTDEGAIVQLTRKLQRSDRHALLRIAAIAAGTPLPDSDLFELPTEDALARMFEGLLHGEDLTADPSDIARMLARQLPTALEQTQDVRPVSAQAEAPAADTPPPPPAKRRPASPRSPRT